MTSDLTALIVFIYVATFTFIMTNGVATIRRSLDRAQSQAEESKEGEVERLKYSKKLKTSKDAARFKGIDYEDSLVSLGSESLLSHSDHHSRSASCRFKSKAALAAAAAEV